MSSTEDANFLKAVRLYRCFDLLVRLHVAPVLLEVFFGGYTRGNILLRHPIPDELFYLREKG